MKILVFPHAMELGGSQLNAIEIAAAVRDRGHEVGVISEDGPLVERVHALGLRHHQLVDKTGIRPSWRVMRQLRSVVQVEGYDLVHGYEWPPAIEAAAGPGLGGCPVVCTVMSMSVAPFLPHGMPLVVGTRQISRDAERAGFCHVTVIEPPVDMILNAPGAVESLDTARAGVCSDALVMVSVSRLVPELKLEGLLAACDAIAALNAQGTHAHFLVVGDGPAQGAVAAAAERANALSGHQVVHLLGSMDDPRPAYAAGDILIGMGGSAVRCLAFAKPLIVQGERGFWRTATPDTIGEFLDQGWYGLGELGEDTHAGADRLIEAVQALTEAGRRQELGLWGREVAVSRFSLRSAAETQEGIYREALRSIEARSSLTEICVSTARATYRSGARRIRSLLGWVATDDFNDVASRAPVRPPARS